MDDSVEQESHLDAEDTSAALTLDNPEFLLLLKARDNTAWDLVVDRYAKTLRKDIRQSLAKRGLDDDCAADVEQQVWEIALVKIPQFVWHSQEMFYHWLRTIATQHVLTLVYKTRRSALSLDELDETVEGLFLDVLLCKSGLAEATPETQSLLYESLSLLDDALQQLKPRVREMVTRRYLLNETPREMAVLYQVKPETISIILNRAKKTLRTYLEANHYDSE